MCGFVCCLIIFGILLYFAGATCRFNQIAGFGKWLGPCATSSGVDLSLLAAHVSSALAADHFRISSIS